MTISTGVHRTTGNHHAVVNEVLDGKAFGRVLSLATGIWYSASWEVT